MGNFEVHGFVLYFDKCKSVVAKHIAETVYELLTKREELLRTLEFQEDYISMGMPTGEREVEKFFNGRYRITIMTEVRECDAIDLLDEVNKFGKSLVRTYKEEPHYLPQNVARWIDDLEFSHSELYACNCD